MSAVYGPMFGHGISAGNGELAGALLGTGALLNARRGNRRDMERRHEMDLELANVGYGHHVNFENVQARNARRLARVQGKQSRLTDAQRQGHERGMQGDLFYHQQTAQTSAQTHEMNTQTSAQDHEIKKMRQEGTTYRSNVKAVGKVISGLGAGGAEGAVAPGAKSVNLGGNSVTFNAPTKPARKRAAPTTPPAGGKKPAGGTKQPTGGKKPAGGGKAPAAPKTPKAPKVK